MRQGSVRMLIVFVLAVFSAPAAYAQAGGIVGEIQGVVKDPSGAAVPNAQVTAVNVGNGLTRSTTTDVSGVYHLPLLPLGYYKVTVQADGFAQYEQVGINITARGMPTVDAGS